MAVKYFNLVTVALLTSQSVIAQTFSDCNPYKGDSKLNLRLQSKSNTCIPKINTPAFSLFLPLA